jgi:inorganic pyrophosphatase
MLLPEPFIADNNTVRVIIETPGGSSNKYHYNELFDYFDLKKMLPAGMVFPFDFGFIPKTKGEDGDPLDVLVLLDFPSFTGCIIECRIIGVLEAEQKEKNKKSVRNDRLIAVYKESIRYADITDIHDLNDTLVFQIISFFKNYNRIENKEFKLLRKRKAKTALKIIEHSMKNYLL